jgi:hypothetical protein
MPSQRYEYKNQENNFQLTVQDTETFTLTGKVNPQIPEDILKDINLILTQNYKSETNKFRKIESPPIKPTATPKPLSLGPPSISLSTTNHAKKDASLSFFQSTKKFISDHKKLIIAATLSGTIGAGIGLTLTFYDQIVSANVITNSLLLGLLAGLLTLIYFVVTEYRKNYQTTSNYVPEQKKNV